MQKLLFTLIKFVACIPMTTYTWKEEYRGANNHLSPQASQFLQFNFAISLLFDSPN